MEGVSARKRLRRHRLPVLFLLLVTVLDGPVNVIFMFSSNCFFNRAWPKSELLIWCAVCFQAMSFEVLKREHHKYSSSATKNIISPLPLPNLAEWWRTMRGSHPQSHMASWWSRLSQSHDKLRPLYLRYHSAMAIKFCRITIYHDGSCL